VATEHIFVPLHIILGCLRVRISKDTASERVEERAPYRECNHEGSQEKYTEWGKEETHISWRTDVNVQCDAGDLRSNTDRP
jgi:hypothetical protein